MILLLQDDVLEVPLKTLEVLVILVTACFEVVTSVLSIVPLDLYELTIVMHLDVIRSNLLSLRVVIDQIIVLSVIGGSLGRVRQRVLMMLVGVARASFSHEGLLLVSCDT